MLILESKQLFLRASISTLAISYKKIHKCYPQILSKLTSLILIIILSLNPVYSQEESHLYFDGVSDYVETNHEMINYISYDFTFEIGTVKTDIIHQLEGQLQLYPNPNNGSFFINGTDEMIGQLLQISDISGRTVYSYPINSNQNTLYIPELKKGTYLVRVSNFQTEKLIIR